jgi:hypothetical protein
MGVIRMHLPGLCPPLRGADDNIDVHHTTQTQGNGSQNFFHFFLYKAVKLEKSERNEK